MYIARLLAKNIIRYIPINLYNVCKCKSVKICNTD